jgi:hypothetical protein
VHVYNSVRRVDCVIATAMGKIAMACEWLGRREECCLWRELCAFAQSPRCTVHVRMGVRRVHNNNITNLYSVVSAS